MGILDSSTLTVDAILTKQGRQRLALGTFNITKFALSDEEIDYNLYDVNHPNGTDYYGAVIENMNLMEAMPNKTGFMSHLVNTSVADAQLNIETLTHTDVDAGAIVTITPTTTGAPSENYTFTIGNTNIVKFRNHSGLVTLVGPGVLLRAQEFGNPTPNATTIVIVTGIDSGLAAVVSITVNTSIYW
jgi:hypothetical protein